MSSIKLKHSGGNSVSLNPPTSAPTSSEVAFKLPNADGSANQLLKTDGSGNLGFISSAVGGKLLQVQYGATSGTSNLPSSGSGSIVADASNSTVDITSLSITPASTNSKIFILGCLESEAYNSSGNGVYGGATIYRGTQSGTALRQGSQGSSSGSYFMLGLTLFFLDSPNTTSSQTYTFCVERWSSSTNNHTVYQWQFLLAEIGA